MRYRFQQFMMGRYGMDQLGIALLVLSFAVSLVLRPFHLPYLALVAYIPLIAYVYRIFSRDIVRRRGENEKFLRLWRPVWSILFRYYRRLRDIRQYRYYLCPNCKGELRVPKGKGKIRISCPRCRQEFIKKT